MRSWPANTEGYNGQGVVTEAEPLELRFLTGAEAKSSENNLI
jgi:hypothetical protein